MADITYNDSYFRTLFPAFANTTQFSDTTISFFFSSASNYVSTYYSGYWGSGLSNNLQIEAVNLMTAHLLYLATKTADGEDIGIITSASIDQINVSIAPPPVKTSFQYWLSSSPYGAQLRALFSMVGVGGFANPVNMPVTAFRPINGGYWW